ncbi:MAG: SurA N-terminal domain-containing protein [Candidatus Omnitrophica bacterium]|nr:SurA N-terminal domain-containing protein [Candidatus Omnitrophota bacterium]
MLKILRHKNVSKFILWGILILILPAFVVWGAGSMGKSGDKGPKFVGTIYGKKVSFDNFAGAVSSVRCQIFLNYFNNPKVLDELLKNQSLVGKIAWDRLIMIKEAKRLKIKSADAEVIAYIRSHPLFMRNGRFDTQLYEYILRNNLGLDPRTFEEIVRENIAMQKMNESLTKDIAVSDDELGAYYRAENCKFKISYALLAEGEAVKDANAIYKKISDTIGKGNMDFESACVNAGLKLQGPLVFSKTDYIEGLGEALGVAAEAVGMKKGDISAPVMMRKGVIVFKLIDEEGFDQDKFTKEKPEYSKKVSELKKNMALEIWLKGLEQANTLNIDLKEYEKYYH